MKQSQQYISKTFPKVETFTGDEAGMIGVAGRLFKHFEDPESNSFDMQQVWQQQDKVWSDFVLKAFTLFYQEDMYRKPEEAAAYINQNDVAELFGISKQTLKKRMETWRKVPKPDLYVSGYPAWDRENVKRYIQKNGQYDDKDSFSYPTLDE